MKKGKKTFRIWAQYKENGLIQEYPMEITFNDAQEAEKCAEYLISNLGPWPYTHNEGRIVNFVFREDKTENFKTFEDYLAAHGKSQETNL